MPNKLPAQKGFVLTIRLMVGKKVTIPIKQIKKKESSPKRWRYRKVLMRRVKGKK